MNDSISRQAAISLPVKPKEDRYFQTQNLDDAYDYGWWSLQECIKKLPSTQPEVTEEAVKEYCRKRNLCVVDSALLKKYASAQPDFNEWCHDCKEYDSEKHCCPRFNRVIRQAMKDAQPERKKGTWAPHKELSREYIGTVSVNVTYDFWFCDICGYQVKNGQPIYNFCPNCGADMRRDVH